MPVVISTKTIGHCRTFHVSSKTGPKPSRNDSCSASVGPTITSPNATTTNTATPDGECDRGQPNLPPRARLLDVVGAIERVGDADHRRRTAPQRHQEAKGEQAAVVPAANIAELIANDLDDLGGRHAAERGRHVLNHPAGQKAGKRQYAHDGGHERSRK